MDCYTLLILASMTVVASAWSFPFYPVLRATAGRVTRFAPPHLAQRHRLPIRPVPIVRQPQEKPKPEPPNPDYDYYEDEYEDDDEDDTDHNHDRKGNGGNGGITGPVHTFVKTDKNANYKWGVRHHVRNR